MRLRFGGSDPAGGPVTVEFQVVAGQVRCWAGDAMVLLDQEALAGWLAAPRSTLTQEGVTFEPAQWGVVFAFAGRVQRTVITPADVTRLADLIGPTPSPADTTGTTGTSATPQLAGSPARRAR